jgi:hypothetical protein
MRHTTAVFPHVQCIIVLNICFCGVQELSGDAKVKFTGLTQNSQVDPAV